MTQYLAFTIGPIYRTIIQQRKTRAVFAASYLFSYIMRTMIKNLLEIDEGLKDNILTPSPDFLEDTSFKHTGCGLYSDRLIMWDNEKGAIDKLLQAREKTLEHLVKQFPEDAPISKEYLEQYLVIYPITVNLEKGEDTIDQINRYLDNMELYANVPVGEDKDLLNEFFSSTGKNFIIKDAYDPEKAKERFPSLPEIATVELQRSTESSVGYDEVIWKAIDTHILGGEESEDSFYAELRSNLGDRVKDYHKYIAIVNVDGDSFGKYIGGMNADEEKFKSFSRKLMQFGKKARKLIEDYGGASVYIGGDDLLFFAPVASVLEDGTFQTIFHLIEKLDKSFHHTDHFPPKENCPTLSYGISFSYYKYPLNEALLESYELLDKAKDGHSHPDKRKRLNKNAIAFKVLKHSGQYFEAVIDKGTMGKSGNGEWERQSSEVYQKFLDLIKDQIHQENFINSLTHNMAFFQDLMGSLLLEEQDSKELVKNENAIQHLFDNNLNESIHDQHRGFINQVVKYVLAVYRHIKTIDAEKPMAYISEDKTKVENMSEEALSIIYSTLRFIHFIGTSATKPELSHV